MTIRKSADSKQGEEQVFEEVNEQVSKFTITQLDREIVLTTAQIQTCETWIAKLRAKKAAAEGLI